MVTESGASASAKQRQEAKRQRRKQSVELISELRSIASQYKVCYEIWPVSSISEEGQTGTGFELLICGVNGHLRRERGVLHPVPGCQQCARCYAELREIAEWIIPLKNPPLSYCIYSFDNALHLAPAKRQHRSEIIITAAIFDQDDDNQQQYSESECLKEVRERFHNLGIREDVSPLPVTA